MLLQVSWGSRVTVSGIISTGQARRLHTSFTPTPKCLSRHARLK